MPRNHAVASLQDVEGAVITDRYDRRVYEEMRERAAEIQAAEAREAEHIPSAPLLIRDFWASLYKMRPRIIEEANGTLAVHKKLLEMAQELGDWEDLRSSCRLDQWASALAATVVAGRVLESLPDDVKKDFARAAEAERIAREFMRDALFNREGAELAAAGGDAAKASKLRQTAELLEQQAQDAWQNAAEIGAQVAARLEQRDVRQSIRSAARDALEAIEDAETFAWGSEAGRPQNLFAQDKFALAWKLFSDPKLKEIARLAGRMQEIAKVKRRTRIKQEPVEIVDVETGNDLSRVLPSELVALRHPTLRKDFLRRFTEENLMQYRLEGKEKLGRGPIVACLDSSGSMAEGTGWKEKWAKAVALALFHVAAREARAFACIHFGSRSEIKTFLFPNPRKARPAEVAEMVSFFFDGGTDFERPLMEAVKIVGKMPYKKGDIVFITDGECLISGAFDSKFRRLKAEKEFSVISVLMPGGRSSGVRPFSDKIVRVGEDDDTEALDVVFSLSN